MGLISSIFWSIVDMPNRKDRNRETYVSYDDDDGRGEYYLNNSHHRVYDKRATTDDEGNPTGSTGSAKLDRLQEQYDNGKWY